MISAGFLGVVTIPGEGLWKHPASATGAAIDEWTPYNNTHINFRTRRYRPGRLLNDVSTFIDKGVISAVNQRSAWVMAEAISDVSDKALQSQCKPQQRQSKLSKATYLICGKEAEWH